MSTYPVNAIVIRPAERADTDALHRLAALDSARALTGRILLAEVDGELRAALSTETGTSIADPFFRTAGLVVLLEVEARQERRRRAVPALPLQPRANLRVA
jgi:hypothetical protein